MLGLTATSIYTFNCKNSENSKLEKLSMYLKRLFDFTFFIKALYKPFVCLPVKNQPYKFVKDNFESFKDYFQPVGIDSKFGWQLNEPVPWENCSSTNRSFVNENASHFLFSNSQQSINTTLEKELHHF